MTMARFPRGKFTADGGAPEWLTFIWEVNGVRPGTFGKPETQQDTPRKGYDTEKYPGARVIHAANADEGVRIVADTPEVAEAFRTAAAKLGIHMTPS